MEDLEDEIAEIKREIARIKESEEIDRLDKAVTQDKPPEPPRKKTDWKKLFTVTLVVSKLVVFVSFLYTSMVLYKLDKTVEALVLLVTIALYLTLNKLEKL